MCEIPRDNASNEEITKILKDSKNIAIVGISADETKDSNSVAKYIKQKNYQIFPVNPKYDEVIGEKCYKNLKLIPQPIDIVVIFRKPEAIPAVVDEAIDINAKTVWMQLGLANNSSAAKARKSGLSVVMNKCIKVEHANLI